jgi:ATP-binding cassette subfamily B protein
VSDNDKKTKDRFADIPQQKYKKDNGPQRPFGPGGPGGPGGGPARFGPGAFGAGMPTDKVKDFRKTLKSTLKYMWPLKWMLAAIVLFSALTAFMSVFTPVISARIIDNLDQVANGIFNHPDLIKWILFLVGISLFNAMSGLGQQWISADVTQKVVYNFRFDLERKLSKLPLKFFDGRTHGEILSRVVYDVETVAMSLQPSVTMILSSAIQLIGILIMMLSISPLLTLITMSVTPLYILVVYIIAPRSQRYFVGQSRSLGDLNGHVEEMYAGQRIVKLFNYEDNSIKEFEEINDRYYQYSRKAQFISGMIMPLIFFLGNLGYVLVCVVGGVFMIRGLLTLGSIFAFIQYVRQFNMPIAQTSQIINEIQSMLAAAERIFAVLEETEEVPEAAEPKLLQNPQGAVCFEHVEFGYADDNILMNDMDIRVKPGQVAAIVGPTGAGKTTFVNLLMRFYDVNKGRITVDGVDIRDMTRGGLRTMFGMVLQDTWLYSGAIKDNIAYGKPDASLDEIIAASMAARSDHFIRTLPDGYDTIINEDATNISQGQKQMLTIARAFLANPAILILDEATSSVDTRTEMLIQHAMEELMKGRTSFVIAHRLSTIRDADIILVMNHGDIVEQGTHEGLLDARGVYYDMYNSQFNGEEEEAQEQRRFQGQSRGQGERRGRRGRDM